MCILLKIKLIKLKTSLANCLICENVFEKTETCCFYVVNSSRVTLTIITRKIEVHLTLYWNLNIFKQNSFHLRAVEKKTNFFFNL